MTTSAQHRSYQRALMAGSSYVATVWSGEADAAAERARKSGADGPLFGGAGIVPDGATYHREATFRHELESSIYRK